MSSREPAHDMSMVVKPDLDRRRFFQRAGYAAAGATALAVLRPDMAGATTTFDGLVLDQGGGIFNVRSSAYTGANDTATIQNAINAASAAGGGTVFLPQGTYTVDTLTIPSKVHLRGAGIEATILRANSVNNGAAILETASFASQVAQYNWSVRDLTIDGSIASVRSYGYGIRSFGYGFVLDSIRVRSCVVDGIYSEWAANGGGGSPGQDAMEAQLVNFKSHDNGGNGVTWRGPHDSQWVNGVIYSNGSRGVSVEASGSYSGGGLQAVNCHSWGTTQAYAWYLAAGAWLLNCEGEGGSVAQVFVGANDCQIIGGSYFSTGVTGTVGIAIGSAGPTPPAVQVAGTHVYTHILNCTQGAVAFAADAGVSLVEALVYAGSPTAVLTTGTIATNSRARLLSPYNRGSLTAPTLTSNVTVTNNFGVDCSVYITGGNNSISSISVAGVVTGIKTGCVRVPAGQTVKVVFSGTASWTWYGD